MRERSVDNSAIHEPQQTMRVLLVGLRLALSKKSISKFLLQDLVRAYMMIT